MAPTIASPMSAISRAAPAVSAWTIVLANYVTSDAAMITVMCVSFFGQGWINLGWTLITDVAPKKLHGLTTGFFNFCTNMAGIITPIVIGYAIQATGSYALGLESNPQPDAASIEGLKRLLATVKEDQLENGSWASWPETRPPLFGNSDERATIFATLALLPAAARGDDAAKAARDRGVEWLINTKTDDDPQCVAMRIVLWNRLGRPAAECELLVKRIKDRQNADGGWSQTPELACDGWATGQSLYALAHAGIGANDPAIQRGHEFLIKSQREDGSWPMTSRPTKPGGDGSSSLIPITGGGSAWAIIGLARSR